jgi:hypothetical protein
MHKPLAGLAASCLFACLGACNPALTSKLADDLAAIECAELDPARIPMGAEACATITGDVISIGAARARGLIAKKAAAVSK